MLFNTTQMLTALPNPHGKRNDISIWLYQGRRLGEKSRSSHLYTTDALSFFIAASSSSSLQGQFTRARSWRADPAWLVWRGTMSLWCEGKLIWVNLPISFNCAPCSLSNSPHATSFNRVLEVLSKVVVQIAAIHAKWGIQVRNSASCEMCVMSSTLCPKWLWWALCSKVFLTEPTKGWMRLQWQSQRQALCGCHATSS